MGSKLRRLASDHANLQKHGLPPNFLFHPLSIGSTDLTRLSVCLAGPDHTPYSQGIFHLELRMKSTYPSTPPTAHFRTKIFHPNVDPSSGAICVDTLKRDWKPELTLCDVLITISCLLVCPNTANALNVEAGHLMDDDFLLFDQQASMWSQVHAAVPLDLQVAVKEAKTRVIGIDGAKVTTSSVSTGKKQRIYRPDTVSAAYDNFQERENTTGNNLPASADYSLKIIAPKKGAAHATPSPAGNRDTVGLGLSNVTSSIDVASIHTPTQAPKRQARKRYAMLPPTTKGYITQFGREKATTFGRTPVGVSNVLQSSFLATPSTFDTFSGSHDANESLAPYKRPQKRLRTCSHSPPPSIRPYSAPIESIPRLHNPCLPTLAKRDPTNDPFSSSFTMPWLDWEKFISSVPQCGLQSHHLSPLHKNNPRRGIFRF